MTGDEDSEKQFAGIGLYEVRNSPNWHDIELIGNSGESSYFEH